MEKGDEVRRKRDGVGQGDLFRLLVHSPSVQLDQMQEQEALLGLPSAEGVTHT